MRLRRVIAQAVVERVVGPSTGATTAAVAEQLRGGFQLSHIAQAPRQGTKSKKSKTAKSPKRAKAKSTSTPTDVKTEEEEEKLQPAAVNSLKAPLSTEDKKIIVSPLPANEEEEVKKEASPSDTLLSSDTAGVPQNESVRDTSPPLAVASSTATWKAERDAAPSSPLHRRGNLPLHRSLLVGAHAALEGTKECPDPRAWVPRLHTEVLKRANADADGATAHESDSHEMVHRTQGVRHHITLPSPSSPTPSRSTVTASGDETEGSLSTEAAIDVLANTFAFTLHSVRPRWRAMAVAAATGPVHTVIDTAITAAAAPSSSSSAAATPALSFLSSPFVISAAQVLSNRSPFFQTIVLETSAPLQWLQTSFEELCRRVACDLRSELLRRESSASDGEAAAPLSSADVCRAVREHAARVVAALEKAAVCVGSPFVVGMRRQYKRDAAAAAASRRRKSNRPAVASAKVEDTLLNAVDRVALELHLMHGWVSRLCEGGVASHDSGGGSSSGAPCVEAAVRETFSWRANEIASVVPSAERLQWMLATAMLEQVHVQTYRFHHSRLATATHLTDASDKGRAGRTYVVEEKQLDGLAALVDFALGERDAVYNSSPASHSAPVAPTTPVGEGLLVLLNAFYAVLPVYAVLLPAWQRLVALSSTASDTAVPTHTALHDGAASVSLAESNRDRILAASPSAVWDAVAEHWARQEEQVRQEGALAALWWLRVLPLWISTIAGTLQLRVVVAALTAAGVPSRWTTAKAQLTAEDGDTLHALVVQDIAVSLDVLLEKSGDFLRDVLRFDRIRYERTLDASRAINLQRNHTRSATSDGGPRQAREGDARRVDGASAASGVTTTEARETEKEARERRDDGGNDDDGEGAELQDDATPPLQRHRGKRSLFYKSLDRKETSVLQGGDADVDYHDSRDGGGGKSSGGSSSGSHQSRFATRFRPLSGGHGAGAAAGHKSSSSGGGGGHASASASPGHHRSASTLEAHERTSALFDVMVLSDETPILLAHRFGLDLGPERSCAVEESWAAATHAKSELWRLLYALPTAAAVAGASTRSRNGSWSAAQTIRSVLPPAVRTLLPVLEGPILSPTSVPRTGTQLIRKQSRAKGGDGADLLNTAASDGGAAETALAEERVLRSVLGVVERVQALLGLAMFESLEHLLVAVARVLLRIQHVGRLRNPSPTGGEHRGGASLLRRSANGRERQLQTTLMSVVAIGATALLADNLLSWEGLTAAWQLRQLRYTTLASAGKLVGVNKEKHATVASSAAMHAFAVQWTTTLSKDIPFVMMRAKQQPDAVLANVREILRVLQDPSTAAALPLYAKQVSAAAVLQSLMALASNTRSSQDTMRRPSRPTTGSSVDNAHDSHGDSASSVSVARDDVLGIYQELLDILSADADLRLLCCYAAFVDLLYDVHLQLDADHAALIAWADQYLLPLALPVVVAGLHRSQSTHNAASHADLCETTLVLLSPLSRYATNPQVALVNVLRSRWNHVLLQVSLYCIRVAGRGGVKRAADYGMPPVALPDVAEAMGGAVSMATTAVWWTSTFAHGAEPVFLSLLDCSNSMLMGFHRIEPRDIDMADGVWAALDAYVTAWDTHVCFGRRKWADAASPERQATLTGTEHDGGGATTQTLLSRLQTSCAAVETFGAVAEPARMAAAEAAPFLASKPAKARQLGYLIRFMEHYLREQERQSSLGGEERQSGASQPLSPSPTCVTVASDPLSETAALVLLDFVGHLSSAGGWAMVTWSCNLAETVVRMELKRHRSIPEATKMVAATAILSQIRAVPSAPSSMTLPANLQRSLLCLSDMVGTTPESLFGFPRRSSLHGLLNHPTRDQYRVLTFGLKQATAYVQMGARRFRAWQDEAPAPAAAAVAPAEDHVALLAPVHETADQSGANSNEDEAAVMSRRAGRYYAVVWAANSAATRRSGTPQQAGLPATDVTALNRNFHLYLCCLLGLIDACMESARLYLFRQQGDGEEDLRAVIEAAVMELCRTLAANIQSFLSLTHDQRKTCFLSEEAQLVWMSLCAVATIGTVAPLDHKDRFFTPRCTQAIQKLCERTRELVESVIGTRVSASDDADAETFDGSRGNGAAPLADRPLCTALVFGAQSLLRDGRVTQRLSIRLAFQVRSRDDLTAMLTALSVLLRAACAFQPARSLLLSVWERLAAELSQPLPVCVSPATPSTAAAAPSARKTKVKALKTQTVSSTHLNVLVAATVPSRDEYGAALRDLVRLSASLTSQPCIPAKTDGAGSSKATSKRPREQAGAEGTGADLAVLDVAAATANVVEDAAALLEDHQRALQLNHRSSNDAGRRADESDPFSAEERAPSRPTAFTHVHLSVAASLESGTMSLSEVLDAAIAHVGIALRAVRDSSSALHPHPTVSTQAGAPLAETAQDDGTSVAAFGAARLVGEYYQDMMDLLHLVPLCDILRHPNVESLFVALNILPGSVKPDAEDALWRTLTAKWRAELIAPWEATFYKLQQSQLALVRAHRGLQVSDHTGSAGDRVRGATQRGAAETNSASSTLPPPDIFARVRPAVAATASSTSAVGQGRATAEGSAISAAALKSMQEHWFPETHSLPHHDDGRRLSGSSGDTTQLAEAFPGELDDAATGMEALASMPDPVPLPVLLSLLESLTRRRDERSSRGGERRRYTNMQLQARTTWLAAGGSANSETSRQGSPYVGSPVVDFVDVLLTYVARTYWLLRPRLDDNAWLVWATVERGMAAYPAAKGVRQQQWDSMCRRWRLPTNMEHATAAAGHLFTEAERRHIAAWMSAMQHTIPGLDSSQTVGKGREEVAVFCYIRAMALYLQLLSLSMNLLFRHRMLGDLPDATTGIVRRRVQVQLQEHGGGGQDEDSAHALTRTALVQELKRLAQDRQTQAELVNRNFFESAALQYLNVSWCVLRHADSLTHLASDSIVAALTNVQNGEGSRQSSDDSSSSGTGSTIGSSASSPHATALVAYADEVRIMVTGVVQETLAAVLRDCSTHGVSVIEQIVHTLLTSGFACDPLNLRVPHVTGALRALNGRTSSGTAPAVAVVATLLNSAVHPVARAELFVSSPTILAVLTPHFTKNTLMTAFQGAPPNASLLPVVSALEFYLTRRNVPLSPLLEATTELLTSCAVRSSAVHTYCERLASELARRKEFRQALEPPTVASVEQGGAGSIANEVVVSFAAAIARHDVHVTKKTLAHLLHFIMSARLDVFGQPPTANRQGKLTLVRVGTTVETTIDTTNPLYTPKHAQIAASTPTKGSVQTRGEDGGNNPAAAAAAATPAEDDDAAAVMDAFHVDQWTEFTAMTHRKALAALTIPLPTVMEIAMHMEAMRHLDAGERRRAMQMLKAADDARRERVAVHRSQAQVAATAGSNADAKGRHGATAPLGRLDASLHLEDPRDFGVAMLHLRYALRKVLHASLRRLLHQQGPQLLAEVAAMLALVDPGMHRGGETAHRTGGGNPDTLPTASHRPKPYDGVLAGTTRVLLSRAVLCAQGIGYDSNGAALELPPVAPGREGVEEEEEEPQEAQSVLKLPVPALQASAVDAAILAQGTAKGRHHLVGSSSGKIGLLTKEEKAAVHQRVELEREAAVTVGTSTLGVPLQGRIRIARALRNTRRQIRFRQQRREVNARRFARPTTSAMTSSRTLSPSRSRMAPR